MSCSIRCRWLNVPLTVSCPLSRIGTPPVMRLANESASAWAQVSLPPTWKAAGRWAKKRASLGLSLKPSGMRASCRSSSARRSMGTVVATSGSRLRSDMLPAGWAATLRAPPSATALAWAPTISW